MPFWAGEMGVGCAAVAVTTAVAASACVAAVGEAAAAIAGVSRTGVSFCVTSGRRLA